MSRVPRCAARFSSTRSRAPLIHRTSKPSYARSRVPNQRRRFARESGFGEEGMRRKAAEHKNFFIAKPRDSESAQAALSGLKRAAMTSSRYLSMNCSLTESPAMRAHLAKFITVADGFSKLVRIIARKLFRALDQRASRALTSAHQHFLKRDAVFSDVLVYSRCSAFRFPNARSD